MKKLILFFAILISINGFSQALNAYEFLVIPSKFDFQKQEDQYGTQTLMEAYFKQKGFTVIRDSKNMPEGFNNSRCKSMFVAAKEKSNMFATKIKIQIIDCNGKILLESAEGISKEKQYDLIYKQAVRFALQSLPEQNYKFDKATPSTIKEIVVQEKTTVAKKESPIYRAEPEQQILKENQNVVPSKYQIETLSNGFLIIEKSSQKVFLKLYKTATPNVFLAKMSDNVGIATKQNSNLTLEFVVDNVLKTEVVSIDF